jgi:hypothetical protein
MMLLLRILEDIMRAWALENTSSLLSLVMIPSKTCWNGRCWLSQWIHPTERKWMIEWRSWCSCAKITCMLEIIHWKTSSLEIILIVLILMIESIINICCALFMRTVLHSISRYRLVMQRLARYSSTCRLFHHNLMMFKWIHELSFSRYLTWTTSTIFVHLLNDSLFVCLLLHCHDCCILWFPWFMILHRILEIGMTTLFVIKRSTPLSI